MPSFFSERIGIHNNRRLTLERRGTVFLLRIKMHEIRDGVAVRCLVHFRYFVHDAHLPSGTADDGNFFERRAQTRRAFVENGRTAGFFDLLDLAESGCALQGEMTAEEEGVFGSAGPAHRQRGDTRGRTRKTGNADALLEKLLHDVDALIAHNRHALRRQQRRRRPALHQLGQPRLASRVFVVLQEPAAAVDVDDVHEDLCRDLVDAEEVVDLADHLERAQGEVLDVADRGGDDVERGLVDDGGPREGVRLVAVVNAGEMLAAAVGLGEEERGGCKEKSGRCETEHYFLGFCVEKKYRNW